MPKDDKPPPLLTGFSKQGAEKGKALTSPTTSMWLAIIFVALLFAIGSVQKTMKKVDSAKDDQTLRYSPWLSDAPEKIIEREPPPNPDLLFNHEEEEPTLELEDIELEKESQKIEIKPIDVELQVDLPAEMQSRKTTPN